MNNKFLLCLLIVCLTSDVVISKFGSRSSSSRSRSSGSHSSGRSSSHSSYKPSSSGHKYPSSSGLSGSGSVKHNYPSSSSGLSGSSWSGHSAFSSSRHSGSGSIKPSYPSSSSGLSGSRGSKPHYPSASSGLSGIGFNKPSQSSSSHFLGSGSLQPSYPSSSSGLSGSDRSKPFYPSSSSGLSGSYWSKPSPLLSTGYTGSGGIKHDYPSLSSGLSGFGESKPHYPSDSSGLSGIGFGKPSQSSSSHFLEFGSLQPSYPSSSSGLSGFGGSKPFDQPSSGFSGVNWNKPSPALSPKFTESRPIKPEYSPSSGPFGFAWNKSYQPDSKKVSYPPSSGNWGNENHMYPKSSGNFNKPYDTPFQRSNTYHAHSGPDSHHYGYNGNTHVNYAIPPNYHMFPQYVYVSQYRNSGSRYGDILTGLALYNMGRSHSHDYREYYFHDDYYRTRYVTQSGNGYTHRNSKRPKDEAICTLTIKETDRQELLKIPCEIVSTFVEDGKRTNYTQTQTNITTCVTNLTTIDNAVNQNTTNNSSLVYKNTQKNTQTYNNIQNLTDAASLDNLSVIPVILKNATTQGLNSTLAVVDLNKQNNLSLNSYIGSQNSELNTTKLEHNSDNLFNVNKTGNAPETYNNETGKINIDAINGRHENTNNFDNTEATSSVTKFNVTTCTTVSNTTDPIEIKGPPVNVTDKECTVNIITKEYHITNVIDCRVLVKYSKVTEKPKSTHVESSFLPSKAKIKKWLENPPWWLSLFIAV